MSYHTQFLAIDGMHEAWLCQNEVKLKMSDVEPIQYLENAYVVQTGSPHYVLLDDKHTHEHVLEVGRAIRFNERYQKEGINVNLVEMTADGIQVATYERGVEAAELLARLRNEGHSAESLARQLARLEIELVLTAHPTEVARRTLIQKYDAIAAQLAAQDHRDLTSAEREQIQNTLQRLIAEAWHTEEIRRTRPTPVDEAKWGFAVIEHSLWHAIPSHLRKVDKALLEATGLRLPLEAGSVAASAPVQPQPKAVAALPAGDLLRAIKGADKANIVAARVFDDFRGQGVPEGRKSLAVEVTLQPGDKSYTDADLKAVSDRIVTAAAKLGGVLRA